MLYPKRKARSVERHVCATVEWFDPERRCGRLVTAAREGFPFDDRAVREIDIGLLQGERVVARVLDGMAVEVRRSVLR
jgi:hypothetical protein